MTDDELTKRFGWWWRTPTEARLRGAFPDASEKAMCNVVWPHLERAALNYELASRRNGRRKYLLGKRFDRLTQDQMLKLARHWPRQHRGSPPIHVLRYADSVSVT